MKNLLLGLAVTSLFAGNVLACEVDLSAIKNAETLKELTSAFYEQRDSCDKADQELANEKREIRYNATAEGRMLNSEEKARGKQISVERMIITDKLEDLSYAALERLNSKPISF